MTLSTIASLGLPLLQALDARGLDSRSIFLRADLDPEAVRDPDARLPYRNIIRLWRIIEDEIGDQAIGLEVARYWHPTNLQALGYAWLASLSLKDALERMVRYQRVMSDAVKFSLSEDTDTITLTLESRQEIMPLTPAAIDGGLALVMRMSRMSASESFKPLRVMLARKAPKDSRPYRWFFKAPIIFQANANELIFDRETIYTTLPSGHQKLALASDNIIRDYLQRLDQANLATQVKIALIRQLPSGKASLEDIAHSLHLSLRSLQRRLSALGTSYQKILDDTRRELAEQYLRDSDISIKEVAYLLGFEEPGNFTRAFRRWYGTAPSEFREGC